MSYDSWAAFVDRYHRAILVVSLGLVLLSGLSLRAVRFDFDVLEMLPSGTAAFDDFKRFVAEFGELDELVILLEGDDPARLRFFADRFGEHLRELPETERVRVNEDPKAILDGVLGPFAFNYLPAESFARLEALSSATTPGGGGSSGAGQAPGLVAAERPSAAADMRDGGRSPFDVIMKENRDLLQAPMDLTAARLVQRDPLGLLRQTVSSIEAALGPTALDLTDGYVSSSDGRALLIFVRPTQNAFDIFFTTRLMEGVSGAERSARDESGNQDVRVGYTGSYAFALEDAATIRWDVQSYAMLALVAVVAVFFLGYRSLRILPFVTYPLLMTALVTFALSLLLFDRLNAVSISFAAILYGLSVDSGIHYYTRLLQESRSGGTRAAVARTLRALAGANIVASTTTAAVFAIIGFSVLSGVRQLGILTALGMMVNVLQFFVLYPALSFLMPTDAIQSTRFETPRLGRLAAACARKGRAIAALAGAVAALSLYGASRVKVEADLLGLRPATSEAHNVEQRIETLFGAPTGGGAVLVTGPELEPLLERSERLTEHLRAYERDGLLASVRSVTTLLPSAATQRSRLQRLANLPREEIAANLRAALQRHGFVAARFEEFFESFAHRGAALVTWDAPALDPFRLIVERYVRSRADGFTVATFVEPRAAVSLEAVNARLRQDLANDPFVLTGRSRLEHELARVLREEFVAFLALAFLTNLALVVMNFRRPLLSLAILAPQVLVLSLCLCAMFLVGVAVGPVNLIVFPLILGIGIDDCVYLGERYVHGDGIETSVRLGGRALVITSLTTMAGFGFLGLSRYPALAEMGALSALGLFLCLALSLTLLPALLTLALPSARATREGAS